MINALHGNLDSSAAFAPSARVATEPQAASPQTSMQKVALLVGIAILVFMGFSAYSVRKEIQGGAQLSAIKELYFPVLQRLDANIVRIDKIEATYIEVAVTGDRDLFDKAKEVVQQADAAYGESAALDPAAAPDIKKLRADLARYQQLAEKASLAFLQTGGTDTSPMQAMNDSLALARKDLNGFRQAVYDDFVNTLAGSQRDSRVRLTMGLSLGLMNLCFMAVLVYFIRNNMKMMSVIALQNQTLEQRVAERTAQLSQKTNDINAMLQNMKLGVSTVIPGNRIHPEYSSYLRTIFCIEDVADKDLIASLFGRSTLGVDTKDQIAVALGSILNEDAMMFDLNGHLLPREMNLDNAGGGHKIVQMDWSPIVNESNGTVDKVLLISQDVTHLRELELSSAQQKEELEIIGKIIRISVGKFNEFVESANGFIASNRRLITEAKARDAEVVAALFRNMHTIKGNARTFEFTQITDVAHRAEQNYDRLRKDPNAEWDAAAAIADLDAVAAEVARYVKVNEEKLGRKGRAADMLTTRGAFVASEQLAEVRSLAAALAGTGEAAGLATLRQKIDQLGLVTLGRLVSGSIDSLSSLASELHKPTPSVDVVNGEIGFNTAFAEALKSSLMHIIRNSLDHGIESPADRALAHKAEKGKLHIGCVHHGERLEIEISDDGRGLALHKLYEKGVAEGLFAAGERPTREAVAEIIFCAGLSTSTGVTKVSGRGVGMEAVRTFLKEQGATIRIALADSATELGFAPFKFIIDVPSTAHRHAA
jgi:HPt (histidine-containing phosphotransfer) domain-containing protein